MKLTPGEIAVIGINCGDMEIGAAEVKFAQAVEAEVTKRVALACMEFCQRRGCPGTGLDIYNEFFK